MKKKLRTQRQLARRLGIWVVILALVTVWTGLFSPHPYLSIRQYETSLSCGKTEIIRKERLDGNMHYLSANQNTLLLNVVGFRPLGGWVGEGHAALDLTEEEDLSVDVLRTSVDEFLTSTTSARPPGMPLPFWSGSPGWMRRNHLRSPPSGERMAGPTSGTGRRSPSTAQRTTTRTTIPSPLWWRLWTGTGRSSPPATSPDTMMVLPLLNPSERRNPWT